MYVPMLRARMAACTFVKGRNRCVYVPTYVCGLERQGVCFCKQKLSENDLSSSSQFPTLILTLTIREISP